YSLLFGFYWITTSSSSQNNSLAKHIARQFGQRFWSETAPCSPAIPSFAMTRRGKDGRESKTRQSYRSPHLRRIRYRMHYIRLVLCPYHCTSILHPLYSVLLVMPYTGACRRSPGPPPVLMSRA